MAGSAIPLRTFFLSKVENIYFSTDLYIEKLLCSVLSLLSLPMGMLPFTNTKKRVQLKLPSSECFPLTNFLPTNEPSWW